MNSALGLYLQVLERLDVILGADLRDLFGADVTDDIHNDGFLVIIHDRDNDALDGLFAAQFHMHADIVALLLTNFHDAFPAARIELGANGIDALQCCGTVAIVDLDHVDLDVLQAADEFCRIGFLFGSHLGDNIEQGRMQIDLDDLTAGRRRDVGEVHVSQCGTLSGVKWHDEERGGKDCERGDACEFHDEWIEGEECGRSPPFRLNNPAPRQKVAGSLKRLAWTHLPCHGFDMSQTHQPLRWGILATGRIAGIFARAVMSRPTSGVLAAVASRSEQNACRFAQEHNVPVAHDTYEALLNDPAVEAIYVATPHPQHAAWAEAALRAGKHVLCEKPAGMSRDQLQPVLRAAKESGRVFMEAFMYRCHPQTARVLEILRSGVIGRPVLVQGTFGFNRPYSPTTRLWSKELGGGGILDVGCYPVSWARLIAGCAQGLPFADPVQVLGTVNVDTRSGVDRMASAVLNFRSGLIAQVSCGICMDPEMSLRIHGEEGRIELTSPYVLEYSGRTPTIHVGRAGAEAEDRSVAVERDLYTYEVDAFAAAVSGGLSEVPAMTHADSLGNALVLDAWLASGGL